MDKDEEYKWEHFQKDLDDEIIKRKMKERKIIKRHHIDHLWDDLRQTIMKAATNSIKNKQIVKNKMKITPEKKLPLYFDLRYVINRNPRNSFLYHKIKKLSKSENDHQMD
jgi:hypothetical protein